MPGFNAPNGYRYFWYALGLIVAMGVFSDVYGQSRTLTIGDWHVVVSPEQTYAFTISGSDDVLTVNCINNGNCTHAMVTDVECTHEKLYSLTIDTDKTEPEFFNSVCFNANGHFGYGIERFVDIKNLIVKSNTIEIKLLAEGGELKTYSFSLRGSAKAYEKVSDIVNMRLFYKGLGGGNQSDTPVFKQENGGLDI